jgi:hypothetical protein
LWLCADQHLVVLETSLDDPNQSSEAASVPALGNSLTESTLVNATVPRAVMVTATMEGVQGSSKMEISSLTASASIADDNGDK